VKWGEKTDTKRVKIILAPTDIYQGLSKSDEKSDSFSYYRS